MSIALLISYRNAESVPPNLTEGIKQLSQRLNPDHLAVGEPKVVYGDRITLGVIHPSNEVSLFKNSIKMGSFYGSSHRWWEPLAPLPDGSFCLFRCDENYIELATDIVGTRTIWYVHDDDLFLASTSQRALIFTLKSFCFNEKSIPWILSSGSLGPGISWDRRIQCLGNDERLLLNRQHWKISRHAANCRFIPRKMAYNRFRSTLFEAIKETIVDVGASLDQWALTLSGGYDSRALLILLRDQPGLKSVSWGCDALLKQPNSDAVIARKLSSVLKVPHTYFDINDSTEDEWSVFQRFLAIGEGRIDHIRWYMDGFKTWESLNKMACRQIVRGDEGFGWKNVSLKADVYKSLGILQFSTVLSPTKMHQFDLEDPVWPDRLRKKANESLASWRDRLYHLYRIPFVLSALTTLKLPYVNVINPFLSQRIISVVRTLPDELRSDKRLFKDIVRSLSPPIPYANVKLLPDYFPREQSLLNHMRRNIDRITCLSRPLKEALKGSGPIPMDRKKLILRGFIVTEMKKMLANDANAWQ